MSALAFIKKTSPMLAAGFALSLALSSSALALDTKSANAFIDTLQGGLKPYGLSISHNGLSIKGDSITLAKVRLLQRQTDPAAPALPIYLGTVNFDNVKPADDGAYIVGAIRAGADSADEAKADAAKDKGGQLIIAGMEVDGARISPQGKVYTIAQYLPYQKAVINNVSYQLSGKTIISLGDMASQYSKESNGLYRNISKIGAFVYDPAAWPDQAGADTEEMLTSLGYNNIKGHFDASGVWDPQKGELAITEYKLTADNMGSLSLSGKFSGISQDFATAYQKLALEQMENGAPTDAQQRKMGDDALALAGKLNIDSFKAVYQDNSLTGRVLDFMSEKTSQPRAGLVSILKAAVLADTQNFRDQVFAAHAANQINAYLDNPQSMTITARPAQPVTLAAVLQALGTSPEQLINLLGVDVTANQ